MVMVMVSLLEVDITASSSCFRKFEESVSKQGICGVRSPRVGQA